MDPSKSFCNRIVNSLVFAQIIGWKSSYAHLFEESTITPENRRKDDDENDNVSYR